MADRDSEEEADGFFNISEELVQLPTIKASATSELDFGGLLNPPVKLYENLANGCGGQMWPAGIVLAKYMLFRHRDTVRDKTIVEIGAGGGLVGLAVARGCPGFRHPLYITDQENMLELMNQNISLNDLNGAVEANVYDWGEKPPSKALTKPDIVLAADCVYFEPAFPKLYDTLKDLLQQNSSVCYFCFKKRRRADLTFIKAIKKGFDVTTVEDDPDKDIYTRESIFLLRIQKSAKKT